MSDITHPSGTPPARPAMAVGLSLLCIAAAIGLAMQYPGRFDGAVVACLIVAIASEILVVEVSGRLGVTGSESCYVLAAVIGGPEYGIVVAAAACLTGFAYRPYRPTVLAINAAGYVLPLAIGSALIFEASSNPLEGGPWVIALLAVTAVLTSAGAGVFIMTLLALHDGVPVASKLRPMRTIVPALAFQSLFILSTSAAYIELGAAALLFVVVVALAFGYMAQLVIRARDRTREYANLSWGLLSGLIRTLDARDARAARHCAAVAKFSRDIAAACEMSKRDQDLAHTAGLLHDIGRFALSDRVMDRGTQLRPDDWKAIRRHPELGAELLKDIGVYGPVAEIIRAHHERPDGRGYPARLTAGEIPEIAKIVAVAEVYDTLTAPDTYRTPMTSFEALTELRRVAGSQLDTRYVEVLATLLAGQGTEYRHLDDADFDAELDIERRMNDAASS